MPALRDCFLQRDSWASAGGARTSAAETVHVQVQMISAHDPNAVIPSMTADGKTFLPSRWFCGSNSTTNNLVCRERDWRRSYLDTAAAVACAAQVFGVHVQQVRMLFCGIEVVTAVLEALLARSTTFPLAHLNRRLKCMLPARPPLLDQFSARPERGVNCSASPSPEIRAHCSGRS
jgi:hypothetical protein